MEVRRVTKKDLENVIEDKRTEGFKVESRTDRQAVLVKRDLGNALWHVIFLFLTAGIGNVIYILYRYFLKKQTVVYKVK